MLKKGKKILLDLVRDDFQQDVSARLTIQGYKKEDVIDTVDTYESFNVYLVDGSCKIDSGYEFNIIFVSPHKIKLEDIENLDIELEIKDKNNRQIYSKSKKIYGRIIKAKEYTIVENKYLYEIRVVHPFDYLKFTKTSRIYQDKRVSEIIRDVISKYTNVLNLELIIKVDDIKEGIKEYITQYRQSDYDFIKMLCLEEGYNLVLPYELYADPNKSSDDESNKPYIVEICNINEHFNKYEPEVSANFNINNKFRSTNVTKDYYNFSDPKMEYKINHIESLSDTTSQFESSNEDNTRTSQLNQSLVLEKPKDLLNILDGSYTNDLKRYTELKSRKEKSKLKIIKATTKDLGVTINQELTLKSTNVQGISIISLSTKYRGVFPNAIEEFVLRPINQAQFEITIKGILKDTVYKPTKKIKKPRIKSILTAIVSSGKTDDKSSNGLYTNDKHRNNSIDVDDKGRIKVVFHFETNQASSCYLRCSNFFSGNNYGSQFLPRVNSEVIVGFVNGNPNMPIIIGTLHNGYNNIPHSLPINKTKSYIKTYTLPQYEDKEGYNELAFEDKRGFEELSLRAQRDMKTKVLNNKYLDVDNNYNIEIKNNKTELIKADSKLTVEKNYEQIVDENKSTTIKKDKTLLVEENYGKTINQNYIKTVNENQDVLIKKRALTKVYDDVIDNYDKNHYVTTSLNKKEDIKQTLHLTTNNYKVNAQKIEIEVNSAFTIRCGANVLTIDQSGVHIKTSNLDTVSSNNGIEITEVEGRKVLQSLRGGNDE